MIGTVQAKVGHDAEVRKILEAAVEDTRSKDGCVLFRLHEYIVAPGRFALYEVWRDLAALDTRQASAQFKAFLEEVTRLADSAELSRLRMISE